jgi:ribosomal protein L20A (L18A)
MTLEQDNNERVSFLKEQINPQNKPLVNRAFQIQIETIRNADTEKVAFRILQKKKQIENARDTEAIETLYTELEALEWLQRKL